MGIRGGKKNLLLLNYLVFCTKIISHVSCQQKSKVLKKA